MGVGELDVTDIPTTENVAAVAFTAGGAVDGAVRCAGKPEEDLWARSGAPAASSTARDGYGVALDEPVTYRGGRGIGARSGQMSAQLRGHCEFGARGEQRADGGARLAAAHQIDR